MVCIQSLLKVIAFCMVNAGLLPGGRAQVVLIVPKDPSCRATPEMVHDGLMAVTDPICLVENDQPGCNLLGLPDCRACALTPEGVADNVPPCELLDAFGLENEEFGEVPTKGGDCVDCKPVFPPPIQPENPVESVKPVPAHPTESSEEEDEEDYVPIVIVNPTDVFIEAESSVWNESEGSDDGEDDDAEDGAEVTRRLRTQF